ncbi:tetratricopeptide repeat protein [Streptomyces sp. NPDC001777]|uniref:tetratricopeptide repeat protein n=1 Tax=Streptomyces sp. NPDC001777 TaxID=3364608 RepID=UPI0036B1F9DF
MTDQDRNTLLAAAVRLRTEGHKEEARQQLLSLSAAFPADAEVAYQTAWAHDVLGLEAEAAPFYERSLEGAGLSEEDHRGALRGLGSTYRVLGRYEEAVGLLRGGLERFPDDGALRTFLAMALFNTGEHHEAMRLLLELLATSSEDPYVRQYRAAIEYYARDLHATT